MSKKKIDMGDVTVTIPNLMSESEKNNDYIDKVLENVDYDLENDNIESDSAEKPIISDDKVSTNPDVVDEILSSKQNDENSGKRILSKLEKILFAIVVILPVAQMIAMFAVPLNVYIVCSIVFFILIGLASFLLGQYSMVGVEIALISASVFMVYTGFDHGLTKSHFETKSLMNVQQLNNKTPEYVEYEGLTEEEIVKEFSGKLIYYYRYGCADCSAIHDKLELFMKSSEYEMVAIETRTDFGKQMLDLYGVDEVPAGIVIMNDGTYRAALLCKTEDGKQDLDVKNLYYLFDLLAEDGSQEVYDDRE